MPAQLTVSNHFMPDHSAHSDSLRKRIGIAVVEHGGRFLVGIRGSEVHLAGKAEFPGGKCEPGESPAECAVRECREETGLVVEVERLICEVQFDYPEASVHLHFYFCTLPTNASEAVAPPGWEWIPHSQLAALDFPEANRRVIQILSEEA